MLQDARIARPAGPVSRAPALAVGLLLLLYTAALVAVEVLASQETLVPYVADVAGPVRLSYLNTTVSVMLLWGAALLFAVGLHLLRAAGPPGWARRERWFLLSQIAVFAWLGADDRFLLHEWAGGYLGVNDAYVLAVIGAVEVLLLLALGQARGRPRGQRRTLLGAAAAFAVMEVIDAAVPRDLVPRLALEEASKLWGAALMCAFAWQVMAQHAARLRAATAPATGGAR